MLQRRTIPKAIREQVLKEYKHRCAICGKDHPQLHHIDEDPSNNDSLNLIPLRPNCHLTGQHNPHEALDRGKLQFFRIHKHPLILKPQFHPLFTRLAFLDVATSEEFSKLTAAADELIRLVSMHHMGEFYAQQLRALLAIRDTPGHTDLGDINSIRARDARRAADRERHRQRLVRNKERVHHLVVEMLAYQQW